MGGRLELQLLAALAEGAAPAHVLRRRVGERDVYQALAALERRRLVRTWTARNVRLHRLTATGRRRLKDEAAIARLIRRTLGS